VTSIQHTAWRYGGTLVSYVSAGRLWHRECPSQRISGRVAEVWKDSCGCLYCLGCHVVQTGENCGPDDAEGA